VAFTAHGPRPALIGLTEGDTTRRVFADIVSHDYFSTPSPAVPGEFHACGGAAGQRPGTAIVSHEY
jgi:hypothetical protein